MLDRLMVFTGNAIPRLAEDVAGHLHVTLGRAKVGRFSDGEVMVEILENVRGRDVFVLQSICQPTNDNLMELLICIDALKRSSARRITAVMPPSPIRGTPVPLRASATLEMAMIWGTPTPATIRVVQMEPGPIPTFTASAPALARYFAASAVAMLPTMTGSFGKLFLTFFSTSTTPLVWP